VASVSEGMSECAEQKGIRQENEGDCEKIERGRQHQSLSQRYETVDES